MFRKKATRVIVILLIGVFALAVLTGCGGDISLVGTWEFRDEVALLGTTVQEVSIRYEFEFFSSERLTEGRLTVSTLNPSDNTWNVFQNTGSWHMDGNRLTLLGMPFGKDGTYDFRISGNTLTLETDGHTVTMRRV